MRETNAVAAGTPDLRVTMSGKRALVQPCTPRASRFLLEETDDAAWEGDCMVIDPACLGPLLFYADRDGLEVERVTS